MRLPDDCVRLAQAVPYPPIVPREDLGVRAAKFAAGMVKANGVIDAVRACDVNVLRAAGTRAP